MKSLRVRTVLSLLKLVEPHRHFTWGVELMLSPCLRMNVHSPTVARILNARVHAKLLAHHRPIMQSPPISIAITAPDQLPPPEDRAMSVIDCDYLPIEKVEFPPELALLIIRKASRTSVPALPVFFAANSPLPPPVR